MSLTQAASARAPQRASTAWRAVWPHLLALGCYTLLALVVTFPLVLHFDRQIIGNATGAVDGFLGIWNVWWTGEALRRGVSPFVTPLLFYPDGLDLFWQTLSLPQGLLALPITLTAGPLPAYNFLILAGFVLGGYTMFLFARYVVGDWRAALVAGAAYALAPFHLQKVFDAQLEVASIQWVPLFLLALLLTLERQRWYWAGLAGALLLWVGLGTWYYGLYCLIFTGMAALVWALRSGSWVVRLRSFAWGMAPAAVWFALMTPRLLHLLREGDRLLGDARASKALSSADFVAFWLPSPLHPLWGAAVSNYYLSLYPDAILWNVSFGLVATGLAVVGICVAWRVAWRWALLIVATALIAMGETLRLFGFETGIPLPYAMIADWPGVRAGHRPNHFVLLTIALIALLAAYGTRALLQRTRRPGWLAAGLVSAVLLVDGWAAPVPLVERTIPAGYAALPPPGTGGVLPIPLHLNFARSENLWYQTRHGWPIVGGFIGREPPYPFATYVPGVRALRFGSIEPDDILTPGWPELARRSLAAYDLRYVLFHPDVMNTSYPVMRELIAAMGLSPSYADPRLEIYPVPPAEPQVLTYLGAGWGELEQLGGRRWRWMGDDAELRLYNPADQPRIVELALTMESYNQDRPLTLRLGDTDLATLTVSRAAMQRNLRFVVAPGEHVVYLSAPSEREGRSVGRRLSIAMLGVETLDHGPVSSAD